MSMAKRFPHVRADCYDRLMVQQVDYIITVQQFVKRAARVDDIIIVQHFVKRAARNEFRYRHTSSKERLTTHKLRILPLPRPKLPSLPLDLFVRNLFLAKKTVPNVNIIMHQHFAAGVAAPVCEK